jgi:hypothetical protein
VLLVAGAAVALGLARKQGDAPPYGLVWAAVVRAHGNLAVTA